MKINKNGPDFRLLSQLYFVEILDMSQKNCVGITAKTTAVGIKVPGFYKDILIRT